MSGLDDTLAALRAWLAENEPELAASLRPGAPEAALDEYEVEFGLRLPAPLRRLWSLIDGQSGDGQFSPPSFVDNMTLMGVEASAGAKAELDGMIGFDFTDPGHWKREWVPFAENGGGDHLVVDAASGRVLVFWHDAARRPVEATDLEAWLQSVLDAALSGERETF